MTFAWEKGEVMNIAAAVRLVDVGMEWAGAVVDLWWLLAPATDGESKGDCPCLWGWMGQMETCHRSNIVFFTTVFATVLKAIVWSTNCWHLTYYPSDIYLYFISFIHHDMTTYTTEVYYLKCHYFNKYLIFCSITLRFLNDSLECGLHKAQQKSKLLWRFIYPGKSHSYNV